MFFKVISKIILIALIITLIVILNIKSTSKSKTITYNYNVNNKSHNLIKEKPKKKNNYVGELIIPSIKFKQGFYDLLDINNQVDKNIEVRKESIMPGVDSSLMVIVGHSGNAWNSYFTNLDKININDEIIVNYKQGIYIYKVVKKYNKKKTNNLKVRREKNQNKLILVTCDEKIKDENIVVVAIN